MFRSFSYTKICLQMPVNFRNLSQRKKHRIKNFALFFSFIFHTPSSFNFFIVQIFFVRLLQSIENRYFCLCRKWLRRVKTSNTRKLRQTARQKKKRKHLKLELQSLFKCCVFFTETELAVEIMQAHRPNLMVLIIRCCAVRLGILIFIWINV